MKHWRSKILFVMAVALAMGLGTQTAKVDAVTLGELIRDQGVLRVDDKIFSNFQILENNGLNTDANNLVVTATLLGNGDDQLHFAGLVDGGGNGVAGTGDLDIGYTVSTTSGAPLVHDIQLAFDGIIVSPEASLTVTEQALVDGSPVGTIHVSAPQDDVAYTVLSGGTYASVDVTKDIGLRWSASGEAQFSNVYQDVSQVSAVPEPASVLLLGSGVLGLGLWGWQRRREEPSA